ncbi:MAG TPA: hypothetical protein DCY40_04180 [Actinobacteria bacterium]|nr:hypothetical protein [Actinomycetota bacterium]
MMAVLVGTTDGLWSLPARAQKFAGERIDAIAAGWTVSDGALVRRGDQVVGLRVPHRINWILPVAEAVLLGTAEARLYRLDFATGRFARDGRFDRAPGRDEWYTPWGGPPDVRSIDRGPDGIVYVNVHVGGVVRSTPADPTWQDTMDIDADVHQVVAHPEIPGTALAATARGLAVTRDGGSNWRFHRKGLHGDYCRAVAVADDRVFVSVATSFAGGNAAVYRTDLAGSSFTRCSDGLPRWFSSNVNTGCLAVSGGLAVIGDANGVVYRSDDGGGTWAVLADGLPEVTCVGWGS